MVGRLVVDASFPVFASSLLGCSASGRPLCSRRRPCAHLSWTPVGRFLPMSQEHSQQKLQPISRHSVQRSISSATTSRLQCWHCTVSSLELASSSLGLPALSVSRVLLRHGASASSSVRCLHGRFVPSAAFRRHGGLGAFSCLLRLARRVSSWSSLLIFAGPAFFSQISFSGHSPGIRYHTALFGVSSANCQCTSRSSSWILTIFFRLFLPICSPIAVPSKPEKLRRISCVFPTHSAFRDFFRASTLAYGMESPSRVASQIPSSLRSV